MKKFSFTLLVGFVFLFVDCAKQLVVEQPQQPSQRINPQKPTIWRQSLCPVEPGDPVDFFNSTEIVISGNFLDQMFILDGGIHRKDSVLSVLRKVPKLTPGEYIVKKKSSNGQVGVMTISFDLNNATYRFDFFVKSDGSFTLSAVAELIYNGVPHEIEASTKGGECLLVVFYDVETITNTDEGEAGGVNASRTKIIKIK